MPPHLCNYFDNIWSRKVARREINLVSCRSCRVKNVNKPNFDMKCTKETLANLCQRLGWNAPILECEMLTRGDTVL